MTPAARAARERKQKIFVVVGGLFLVAMLAIQLPKLLGGSTSAAPAPETTTDATGLPAPTTPGATPVAHVTTSPETAKITSFSVFRPKDPFVQQVVTQASPVAGAEGSGSTPEQSKTEGAATAKNGGPAGETTTKSFTTGSSSAAAVTIVTVNGVRQVLEAGMKFPAADPLFVLVAEKPEAKAVVVGIVGGGYAGGAKATRLRKGKPLTLVNTTTGAKYKIVLVSVGNGDLPEAVAPKP